MEAQRDDSLRRNRAAAVAPSPAMAAFLLSSHALSGCDAAFQFEIMSLAGSRRPYRFRVQAALLKNKKSDIEETGRNGRAVGRSRQMNLEKDEEVIMTKLPTGKWAPFLRLNGYDEPISLNREFKTEEMLEGWLDTTEANNLIDQFITKYRKP